MEQPTATDIARLELRTQATPSAVPGVRRAVVDFAELHGLGVAPDIALAVSLLKRVREIVLGVPGLIVWQIAEGRYLLRRRCM